MGPVSQRTQRRTSRTLLPSGHSLNDGSWIVLVDILLRRMPTSGMLYRVDLVRTYLRHHQRDKIRNARRFLVSANVDPNSQFLVTLIMNALSSSETSVLTKFTRYNIPENGILHSHGRDNLKSYIALNGWTL
jgi:hypothetical protein